MNPRTRVRRAALALVLPQDARHTYIVQELCCGGDLSDLLEVSS
jgi:hypothetical protein